METRDVPAGERFGLPDDHRRTSYTLSRLDDLEQYIDRSGKIVVDTNLPDEPF